jgi:hypothetical protein
MPFTVCSFLLLRFSLYPARIRVSAYSFFTVIHRFSSKLHQRGVCCRVRLVGWFAQTVSTDGFVDRCLVWRWLGSSARSSRCWFVWVLSSFFFFFFFFFTFVSSARYIHCLNKTRIFLFAIVF